MRPEIILNPINKYLDKFTPYRLVLCTLLIIVSAAIAFSAVGVLPYVWWAIAAQALWLAAVCRGSNVLMARIFNVSRNKNSDLISALIITLIMIPTFSVGAFVASGIAGVAAMASKYLIAPNRRHIFNPAATGIVVAELATHQIVGWWIGAPALTPLVVGGGLLVLIKMKRFIMAGTFLAVYFVLLTVALLIGGAAFGANIWPTVWPTFLAVTTASPLLFFAYIMLVEPHTSPLSTRKAAGYAALVGALYAAPQFSFVSGLYLSPEIALLLGNSFNYITSNSRRLILKLTGNKQESDGVFSFSFAGAVPKFQAGQYMEWTIPNRHSDGRGNRRYFTVASSPTEKELMLATRMPEPQSSFKKQISDMRTGDTILASDITGSFVLPKKKDQKLAFLAGGIGVTPFRSIAKYLTDIDEQRQIKLICFGNTPTDFSFKDIFTEAEKVGLETVYELVRVNPQLIAKDIPDYKERLFYLSGPLIFVQSAEKILRDLGVKRRQIRKDYFPGYGSN